MLIPSLHCKLMGKQWKPVTDFISPGSRITADGDYVLEIKGCLLFGRKAMTNLDSILKSRDITLPTDVCLVKAMVFPVVMCGCDRCVDRCVDKESWILKNWCFWTVLLERTPESPLDCREIKPVKPKGGQSWVFIGRTDAEVESPSTLSTWCQELAHWKRPWCWERLKAGEEVWDRGVDD